MQPVLASLLAQSGQGSPQRGGDASAIVVWVVVLIGVIIVGGMLVFVLRRRILAADAAGDHGAGLMDSLRKMRDSGQMSQEEYDATRKAMVARLSKAESGNPNPRK